MYYTNDIFDDMLRLRNIFDDYFESPGYQVRRAEFPYVNLYEEGDSIEARMILPGVKSEDIDIQLVQDSLIISGERKSDLEDRPYIRKERDFGAFKKSIKLPYGVDRENISASLKNGILYVTLTRSEQARAKKIEIK